MLFRRPTIQRQLCQTTGFQDRDATRDSTRGRHHRSVSSGRCRPSQSMPACGPVLQDEVQNIHHAIAGNQEHYRVKQRIQEVIPGPNAHRDHDEAGKLPDQIQAVHFRQKNRVAQRRYHGLKKTPTRPGPPRSSRPRPTLRQKQWETGRETQSCNHRRRDSQERKLFRGFQEYSATIPRAIERRRGLLPIHLPDCRCDKGAGHHQHPLRQRIEPNGM